MTKKSKEEEKDVKQGVLAAKEEVALEEKPKIDLSVFKKPNVPKENSIADINVQNAVPAENAKLEVEK